MSRYDTRTTTFSPEGRLYQVEYATLAIGQAASAIGVVTKEGIVLATEKRAGHALLDDENFEAKNISGEKVFKIADHLGCAVAGVNSDAQILVNYARRAAANHEFQYQTPMPVEDICRTLCDLKQGYTQYGGVRPLGVSMLIAGWDKYFGFRLYQTTPSGNYDCWEAYAIGESHTAALSLLKQHWNEELTLQQGKVLAVKILQRTMDVTNLTTDRIEIATLTRGARGPQERLMNNILDPYAVNATNTTKFNIVETDELKTLLEEAEKERQKEEAEKAKKEAELEKRL